MKKYAVEFIGTFFLTITSVIAINNPAAGAFAPLAIGSMYMALIYAGTHISGAHYNPAITMAMLMRGRIEKNDAITYMVVQFLAALAAAAIGVFLHGCSGESVITEHHNQGPLCSLLAEFLGAFVLAYVILHVSTTQTNQGNSHYGLAAGFTVVAAMFSFGMLSGGVFNPAIGLGGAVAGMYAFSDLWIYLFGAAGGAAAAASVFVGVYGRGD